MLGRIPLALVNKWVKYVARESGSISSIVCMCARARERESARALASMCWWDACYAKKWLVFQLTGLDTLNVLSICVASGCEKPNTIFALSR